MVSSNAKCIFLSFFFAASAAIADDNAGFSAGGWSFFLYSLYAYVFYICATLFSSFELTYTRTSR